MFFFTRNHLIRAAYSLLFCLFILGIFVNIFFVTPLKNTHLTHHVCIDLSVSIYSALIMTFDGCKGEFGGSVIPSIVGMLPHQKLDS